MVQALEEKVNKIAMDGFTILSSQFQIKSVAAGEAIKVYFVVMEKEVPG